MDDSGHVAADAAADLKRRSFLVGAGAVVAGGLGAKLLIDRDEHSQRARVFVARARSYADNLADTLRRGMTELGLTPSWVAGKSVLLKPNLVEPTREAPQINTHPAVVQAAADVFRLWGAKEVLVGEGQGHCRDTDWVLDQSGLGPALRDARLDFVDLNHDEVYLAANRMRFTGLRQLGLPESLRRADIIVSMPKLKTHHWVGVTLSMKNLFGVMPGVFYGWPKNVLHHHGIPESILDITGTVRPHLAIVDGIVGMEGDGPVMGTAKEAGVLVLGTNLPAVDATATRLMGIDPWRIPYLATASGRLGPIAERHIEQRGESVASATRPFALIDAMQKALRG
jgi:uncharacterized protein (DUF362 family)